MEVAFKSECPSSNCTVGKSAPFSSKCVAKLCRLRRMRHRRHYAASETMPHLLTRSFVDAAFVSFVCGIVRLHGLPLWGMIKKGFTFPKTTERLRQGPLSKYLDAYSAAQAEQGYEPLSIRQQILVIADFS